MHKIDLVVLPEQKPIFHLQLQMKPADTEADHLNFPKVLNLVQSLRYLDIHDVATNIPTKFVALYIATLLLSLLDEESNYHA